MACFQCPNVCMTMDLLPNLKVYKYKALLLTMKI